MNASPFFFGAVSGPPSAFSDKLLLLTADCFSPNCRLRPYPGARIALSCPAVSHGVREPQRCSRAPNPAHGEPTPRTEDA
ncbi:hypothetical protein DAETH_27790 [Deinococcus aetherius]|uniref:Uncharacterized protein n=1 Tax=Deinococcus aetherius TaxID=200252 RepID=A0ABM8AGA3_9DEIO|nr:hypothetical protein DAETH_27790 [Deinococcus aetherius]